MISEDILPPKGFSMALTINQLEKEGSTLLELQGKLVFREECDAFDKQIEDLLDADKFKIVLNLEEVNYCDSFGLGCLVAAFKSTGDRGGDLKLLRLSQQIQDLLDLTKLSTVFDIHTDEDNAVASFK